MFQGHSRSKGGGGLEPPQNLQRPQISENWVNLDVVIPGLLIYTLSNLPQQPADPQESPVSHAHVSAWAVCPACGTSLPHHHVLSAPAGLSSWDFSCHLLP